MSALKRNVRWPFLVCSLPGVAANLGKPSAQNGHVRVSRVALLLLVSGFMGLRIMALQEQLESLGALAQPHLHHKQ